MIVLMLDQDDAGARAIQEILPLLARKVFVRVVKLPSPGNQPDKLKEEGLIRILERI
jgi:DNA primase